MLQVEGLTKYFGGVAAVDHVSFTVPERSIYALIGPNGAGKTPVFNLITGVLPPDSGKISLKDCRLNGLNPSQIAAAGVARTFQNLQLFGSMTVLENVVTGAYLRGSMGFVRSMVRRPGISPEDRALMQYSLGLPLRWACRIKPAALLVGCPLDSRGFWIFPGHWRVAPLCCFWMNRQPD